MSVLRIDYMRLQETTEAMCDGYCKWPFNTKTQAELDEICDKCPLNTITYDKEEQNA